MARLEALDPAAARAALWDATGAGAALRAALEAAQEAGPLPGWPAGAIAGFAARPVDPAVFFGPWRFRAEIAGAGGIGVVAGTIAPEGYCRSRLARARCWRTDTIRLVPILLVPARGD